MTIETDKSAEYYISTAAGVLTRPLNNAVRPIYKAWQWKYGERTMQAIAKALPFGRKKGVGPGTGNELSGTNR